MNPIAAAFERAGFYSLPTYSKRELQERFANNIINKFIEGKGKATRKELKEFLAIQLEEYHNKRNM
jgi:deoxyribodipyrimidine photolyase